MCEEKKSETEGICHRVFEIPPPRKLVIDQGRGRQKKKEQEGVEGRGGGALKRKVHKVSGWGKAADTLAPL